MTYELIKVADYSDGQIREIVLGPGPANIVSMNLVDECSRELERAVDSQHLKALIISGEGKHFSYGASVEEHLADKVGDMLPRFHRLVGSILNHPVPTIAKVSGLCLGGGFELALACSMIFADENAQFAVPEIQLGVFPPVACILLPLRTASAIANEMILTGRRFGADELRKLGVVNHVAAGGTLDTVVSDFVAEHMLSKSASSLRLACRAAGGRKGAHYKSNIAHLEKLYLEDLMRTSDANEGIQSFLDKRQPKWKDA